MRAKPGTSHEAHVMAYATTRTSAPGSRLNPPHANPGSSLPRIPQTRPTAPPAQDRSQSPHMQAHATTAHTRPLAKPGDTKRSPEGRQGPPQHPCEHRPATPEPEPVQRQPDQRPRNRAPGAAEGQKSRIDTSRQGNQATIGPGAATKRLGHSPPCGPPPPRSRAAGRQTPLAEASTSTHGTLFMRADAAPDQEHEVLVRTTPSLGTLRRRRNRRGRLPPHSMGFPSTRATGRALAKQEP